MLVLARIVEGVPAKECAQKKPGVNSHPWFLVEQILEALTDFNADRLWSIDDG